MATYKICRWDPVLVENNVQPYPMIYIKPDKEFLEFAEANSWAVLVLISGTGTQYDGKHVISTVGTLACERPNLYNATGLYTLTLYCSWLGYPESLGNAVISGLKGPVEYRVEVEEAKHKHDPVVKDDHRNTHDPRVVHLRHKNLADNLENWQLGVVFGAIVILLIVLFVIQKRK